MEEIDKMENKENRRGKRKKRKSNKNIIKIIIAIVIIFIIGIIAYKVNDLVVFDKNKNINLVINNKNVTSNLKKEIIIEDGNIYLSKQDIGNFFDKYIYEDKENNQIITTYDTKVAAISLDSEEITINGTKKETSGKIIQKDNIIYIPITDLENVYGIDIKYIEDSKVLVLDSVTKEQKKAIVTKNVSVKSSKKFIAKTVERVKKGSYVVVVSEENGYTRIRTENGKLGYVKLNKLANIVTVREEIKETSQIEGKVNLVWDYYSNVANAPDRSGQTIDGINVVSPAFFHINSNGELENNIGTSGKEYVEWAHSNGYKVWPMLQNDGTGMMSVTSKIMNDYNKRQKLINEILMACIQYKIDGINLDFENMKQEDKDMYSRFIIELEPRLKEIGLILSVDVTAPDGSETWSLCFDRHVIGDVANYIVFMAYDQYGASSNKAGTTAGYNWVELSLKKFLETEAIESDKIILAIPLYARIWTLDDLETVVKQSAVPIKNINKVIPDGVEKQWDENLKQYYIQYKDGSYTKKMWIEDEKSLTEKISLISKYNLAGVASWEKDMEYDGFWSFLKEQMNK
ncbi:glycoside hydrolase family 18 [Clostridium sp. CAG:575]|nr:glycoside hydrolase family 18 [Clostridium sp. CAG:575]